VILRSFQQGDEQTFLLLVNTAYRNLENLTFERLNRLATRPYFSYEGFFIAEEDGLPMGCVGVFNLPSQKCLEIRYLAVKEAFANMHIVDGLIEAAMKYSALKKPKLVKAVTLTIPPYVEAYKRFGFTPVRRILRIAWDPIKTPAEKQPSPEITITEIGEHEVAEASQTFVEALQPYWDWWVEEEGGNEMVRKKAAEWLRQSTYLVAKVDNKIVGVTAVIPRRERGQVSFSGVMVLPKFRMSGIGSALMNAALNKAVQMGYKRLVVRTLAYLDVLAPGAVLYLKSGGKIEAEYLHLNKELQN
jgi:N-acetylglutamate synthase-like GNAT family acetyltransferase